MSSFEAMPVAIHGTTSPFSLSMNGVPKTCVEKNLLPPPSRHGAILLRIRPGAVTTCESCRSTPGAVGLGRGWTRPAVAVGVARAASRFAADCVGTGVYAAVGVTAAVGSTAGRDGGAVSAGCTAPAAGVAGSAGSSPQPEAATTTMAASTRNNGFGTIDAARFLIPDTASA